MQEAAFRAWLTIDNSNSVETDWVLLLPANELDLLLIQVVIY